MVLIFFDDPNVVNVQSSVDADFSIRIDPCYNQFGLEGDPDPVLRINIDHLQKFAVVRKQVGDTVEIKFP